MEMCVYLSVYREREVCFKELAHETVEAVSQRWESRNEVDATRRLSWTRFASCAAWCGLFTCVPRQFRDSLLIHFWQGDNLCFKFSLLSLFSVAFSPLLSLMSPPATLGMGAVGKWLNQKGNHIYGVVFCFINSFYDIWGWNCFQSQVLLGWGFLAVIRGISWLSLPCLPPSQKRSNVLDLPWVSSGTAVNLFTPSILEIIHSISPDCHRSIWFKDHVMWNTSPLYRPGCWFTVQ